MKRGLVIRKDFSIKCHTKPKEHLEIYFALLFWLCGWVYRVLEDSNIFVLFLNPSLSVKFLVVVTLFMAGMVKLPLKTN